MRQRTKVDKSVVSSKVFMWVHKLEGLQDGLVDGGAAGSEVIGAEAQLQASHGTCHVLWRCLLLQHKAVHLNEQLKHSHSSLSAQFVYYFV